MKRRRFRFPWDLYWENKHTRNTRMAETREAMEEAHQRDEWATVVNTTDKTNI